MTNSIDRIYSQALPVVSRFEFDQQVVKVFSDMIRRSVPGYGELLKLLPLLSERYVKKASNVYDLGCSLGASSAAIVSGVQHDNYQLHAIDNSSDMIEQAKRLVEKEKLLSAIHFECQDINQLTMNNASLIVMNFTLQFIQPKQRQALIQKIYDALNPGSVFLLSEKTIYADKFVQQELDQLHLSFKRANGYSDLEISQKRESLENVLVADSQQEHYKKLTDAGFSHIERCYQNLNFSSFLAWKH